MLLQTQDELDNLSRMRYKKQVEEEFYLRESKILKNKIEQLKEGTHQIEDRAERWLELTEKIFDFITYARVNFLKGSSAEKKAILMQLGQNPVIKDGKLRIEANEWLVPVKQGYKELEARYKRLELKENRTDADIKEFEKIRSQWGGRPQMF